jgi:hypothetical protein
MMNQLAPGLVPKHYLKFTHDVGDYAYYLNTSRMSADNECPVVVIAPGEGEEVIADSFLDFLRQASEGHI